MTPQNKANPSLVALFTKNSSSKSSLFPTLKKQLNTLRVDLSSKLASNSKLISDECKKHLENNLCLYCSAGDHKLDVKFTNSGLSFYLFYFSFLFSFCFIFLFSIFRTTRVGVDRSCCHTSHNLMA